MRRKNKKPKKKLNRKPHIKTQEPEQAALAQADGNQTIRDILNRMFEGSAEELVKSLAESNQLTPQELARMKEIFGKPGARKGRADKKPHK